jgi:hypothetical protein
MVFIRVIRVLCVWILSYLLGELRMIEPKFPFRQFFDFRFGVNASRFFNLPHPPMVCVKLPESVLDDPGRALLYGEPGCGKSMLALKFACRDVRSRLFSSLAPLAWYPGQVPGRC